MDAVNGIVSKNVIDFEKTIWTMGLDKIKNQVFIFPELSKGTVVG